MIEPGRFRKMSVSVTEKQRHQLDLASAAESLSVSAIVRRAIGRYFGHQTSPAARGRSRR